MVLQSTIRLQLLVVAVFVWDVGGGLASDSGYDRGAFQVGVSSCSSAFLERRDRVTGAQNEPDTHD